MWFPLSNELTIAGFFPFYFPFRCLSNNNDSVEWLYRSFPLSLYKKPSSLRGPKLSPTTTNPKNKWRNKGVSHRPSGSEGSMMPIQGLLCRSCPKGASLGSCLGMFRCASNKAVREVWVRNVPNCWEGWAGWQ